MEYITEIDEENIGRTDIDKRIQMEIAHQLKRIADSLVDDNAKGIYAMKKAKKKPEESVDEVEEGLVIEKSDLGRGFQMYRDYANSDKYKRTNK